MHDEIRFRSVLRDAVLTVRFDHPRTRNALDRTTRARLVDVLSEADESREIRDSATRPWPTSDEKARALIEFHTKLRNILAKVDQIVDKAKRLGRPVERVNTVRNEIEQLQKQMLEQF